MIKNSTIIREEIEVERSAAQRDVEIIKAQAESDATITANQAKAQILQTTISQ